MKFKTAIKRRSYKMKKALIALLLLAAFAGKSYATRQDTPDFLVVSTPVVIGVGYSSWSLIMSSVSNLSGFSRIGLQIDHVNQNSQAIMIQVTTSNVAPSSTFYGFTMTETDPPWILSIDKARFVWGITSELLQQVIVQELR